MKSKILVSTIFITVIFSASLFSRDWPQFRGPGKDGKVIGFKAPSAWSDRTVYSDFATIVDCGSVLIGLPSTGSLIVLKPDPQAYS